MKPNTSSCVVRGCVSPGKVAKFTFPRDQNIGRQWLNAINNQYLNQLAYEDIRKKKYSVCSVHFVDGTYYKTGDGRHRLIWNSVPSLNLDISDTMDTMDYSSSEHGSFNSSEHGSFNSSEHGSFNSSKHGSSNSSEHGLFNSSEHGSFNSISKSFETVDIEMSQNSQCNDLELDIHEMHQSTQPEVPLTTNDKIRNEISQNGQSEDFPHAVYQSTPTEVSHEDIRNFEVSLRKKDQLLEKQHRVILLLKQQLAKERRNSKRQNITHQKLVAERRKNQQLQKHLRKMSSVQKNFMDMISQDKNSRRKYSFDEKVLALSVYKKSKVAYRHQRHILNLPSESTLKNFQRGIKITTGINVCIQNQLQESVKNMEDLDKIAVLMFDEVSLSSHLDYDHEIDEVVGFEQWGRQKSEKIADHALLFMLKGIRSGWKMPIAYGFCQGTTSTTQLMNNIKDVVQFAKDSGIRIVATVCDQGSTNQSAINQLVQETDRWRSTHNLKKYGTMLIHGYEIVPLFDVPHIFKCLRNNLMKKDLKMVGNDQNIYFASWDHIKMAYEIDVHGLHEGRRLPKLTDAHIYEDKLKKMSVKHTTQVLSETVGTQIGKLAASSESINTAGGIKKMPEEAIGSSKIIIFLNNLFDALNGSGTDDVDTPSRRPITVNTKHIDFLKEAKIIVKSMCFVSTDSHAPEKTSVPCLKNLIKTIDNFIMLCEMLLSFGFVEINQRHLNQDAVENFFGQVRSHCVRNINPTCHQFSGIFKSMVINNISNHNEKSNCSEDGGTFLCAWKTLCNSSINNTPADGVLQHDLSIPRKKTADKPFSKKITITRESYLKSLAQKFKFVKGCTNCREFIMENGVPFLENGLSAVFEEIKEVASNAMPIILASDQLKMRGTALLIKELSLTVIKCCSEHRTTILQVLCGTFIVLYTQAIITYLNRLMIGKISFDTKENRFVIAAKLKYSKGRKAVKRNA